MGRIEVLSDVRMVAGGSDHFVEERERRKTNRGRHGEETEVYGDQAYQGQAEAIRERAPKAADRTNRRWRTKLKVYPEVREQNRLKSKIRSRVEHVFAVMKLRFGFTKVRFRGLAKNLHRIEVTCALTNLYTASKRWMQVPQQTCA